MTIMVFSGKIADIIASIAKLNGITLGELARLQELIAKENKDNETRTKG